MAFQLRFGAFIHQDKPIPNLIRRWQVLDKLGLDHLWLTDHFNPFWSPTSDWYDAWVLLSALAVQSQSVRVGTLVTPVAYRNPALLAQMIMTLDHLSNGRLEIAIGSGVTEDLSYSMLGISLGNPSEMVQRTRETVHILDELLRKGRCTYQGVYSHITEAVISPRPLQQPRPPLTIAAHRPAMMKVAAQYADTWNTHVGTVGGTDISYNDTLSQLKQRADQFEESCRNVGRDPSTVRRSVMILTEWNSFCASPTAFRDGVHQYRDIGITDFIFPGYSLEREGVIQIIVNEIIPELRRETV